MFGWSCWLISIRLLKFDPRVVWSPAGGVSLIFGTLWKTTEWKLSLCLRLPEGWANLFPVFENNLFSVPEFPRLLTVTVGRLSPLDINKWWFVCRFSCLSLKRLSNLFKFEFEFAGRFLNLSWRRSLFLLLPRLFRLLLNILFLLLFSVFLSWFLRSTRWNLISGRGVILLAVGKLFFLFRLIGSLVITVLLFVVNVVLAEAGVMTAVLLLTVAVLLEMKWSSVVVSWAVIPVVVKCWLALNIDVSGPVLNTDKGRPVVSSMSLRRFMVIPCLTGSLANGLYLSWFNSFIRVSILPIDEKGIEEDRIPLFGKLLLWFCCGIILLLLKLFEPLNLLRLSKAFWPPWLGFIGCRDIPNWLAELVICGQREPGGTTFGGAKGQARCRSSLERRGVVAAAGAGASRWLGGKGLKAGKRKNIQKQKQWNLCSYIVLLLSNTPLAENIGRNSTKMTFMANNSWEKAFKFRTAVKWGTLCNLHVNYK